MTKSDTTRPDGVYPFDDNHPHGPAFEKHRNNLFIRLNGMRIAKRGKPGSRQAGRWVSIVPGYTVIDDGADGIVIGQPKTTTH